jgi:hypothetical protein
VLLKHAHAAGVAPLGPLRVARVHRLESSREICEPGGRDKKKTESMHSSWITALLIRKQIVATTIISSSYIGDRQQRSDREARTWLGELLLQIGVEPPLPGDGRVGCLGVHGLVPRRRRRRGVGRHAHSRVELAGSADRTANETNRFGRRVDDEVGGRPPGGRIEESIGTEASKLKPRMRCAGQGSIRYPTFGGGEGRDEGSRRAG